MFLLGKFIDQVFDAQSEVFSHQEFVTESSVLRNISKELSKVNSEKLKSEVARWANMLEFQLSLEQPQNLSLSNEMMQEINSSNGLIIDSGDRVEIIRTIESHPEFLIVFSSPIIQNESKNKNSNLEMLLTVLFYFGFCLILAIWAFPLVKRLSLLNKMTAEFGAGNLSRRIKQSRLSYIDQLEKSFNRMANQIEDLIAENKLLAGSISHDLRTPLSCLRFGVDAALETQTDGKKDYYLNRMNEDLTRMENMLEAFLDYASLERKRFELVKKEIDVVKLLESTVNGCLLLAEKQHKTIELECQCEIENSLLELDPGWFGRALTNLITNGINYSKSRVLVTCRLEANRLQIIIEDDGAGIPESEVENVFRAFVKLDKSRTKSNHFGLGLAIVARVVSWHDGTIELSRSKKLGGAQFTINLSKL